MEAYGIAGNNYVKLRDIGKAVGFNVFWDADSGCVQIETGVPYTGEAPSAEAVPPAAAPSDVDAAKRDTLLSHFRNRYHGTARLGIEAMELRVRGYSCADIAKLYQKKPNYIGACISRAAEKLRRERLVREFYIACTEQDLKSA